MEQYKQLIVAAAYYGGEILSRKVERFQKQKPLTIKFSN